MQMQQFQTQGVEITLTITTGKTIRGLQCPLENLPLRRGQLGHDLSQITGQVSEG